MKEANALTTESIENRLDELQRARQRDRSSSTRSSSDGMRMSGSGTDVEESTAQASSENSRRKITRGWYQKWMVEKDVG